MTTRRLAAIFAADVVSDSRMMGADDAGARARLKELAAERRRFDWRRLKLSAEGKEPGSNSLCAPGDRQEVADERAAR